VSQRWVLSSADRVGQLVGVGRAVPGADGGDQQPGEPGGDVEPLREAEPGVAGEGNQEEGDGTG
jgi:hypothetical protein